GDGEPARGDKVGQGHGGVEEQGEGGLLIGGESGDGRGRGHGGRIQDLVGKRKGFDRVLLGIGRGGNTGLRKAGTPRRGNAAIIDQERLGLERGSTTAAAAPARGQQRRAEQDQQPRR